MSESAFILSGIKTVLLRLAARSDAGLNRTIKVPIQIKNAHNGLKKEEKAEKKEYGYLEMMLKRRIILRSCGPFVVMD